MAALTAEATAGPAERPGAQHRRLRRARTSSTRSCSTTSARGWRSRPRSPAQAGRQPALITWRRRSSATCWSTPSSGPSGSWPRSSSSSPRRMMAEPDSDDYGSLSVLIRALTEASRSSGRSPRASSGRSPKVDSAVIAPDPQRGQTRGDRRPLLVPLGRPSRSSCIDARTSGVSSTPSGEAAGTTRRTSTPCSTGSAWHGAGPRRGHERRGSTSRWPSGPPRQRLGPGTEAEPPEGEDDEDETEGPVEEEDEARSKIQHSSAKLRAYKRFGPRGIFATPAGFAGLGRPWGRPSSRKPTARRTPAPAAPAAPERVRHLCIQKDDTMKFRLKLLDSSPPARLMSVAS